MDTPSVISPAMDSSTQNPTPDSLTTPTTPETISREAYEQIKKDMHTYKQKNKEYEERLEALKLNGHKEKEDWKEVARIHEETAKDLKGKYEGLKQNLINSAKVAKLTEEAVKHGINPQALPDLELVDFDELVVETTSTGKILVSGQDRAIAKLKVLRPHWFSKSVPLINPTTPSTLPADGQPITVNDLDALLIQYKKTGSESDKQAYHAAIMRYKAQPQ